MPARNHAEPWELALRNTLKASVGAAYRVGEKRGKTRLDVRFSDGSRETATLDIAWLPANARRVQDTVERIAGLIDVGHTVKSARESLYGKMAVAPTATSAEDHQVWSAWEAWGAWKLERNKITRSTWESDYGKTATALKQSLQATDAHDLLERVATQWESGSRSRKQAVQHVAAMLRWAVSKDGKFCLIAKRWTPPPKGACGHFHGDPSPELVAKTSQPTVALMDDEILMLISSLPVSQTTHPRDREAAKRWQFAFQLMATYGIRPVELHHLEVRMKNDQPRLWCNYSKRSGGGLGKPGFLYAYHREWEERWDLINRVASGEQLPVCRTGMGEATMTYLKRNEAFNLLHAKGVTSKSFRHGFAHRMHTAYKVPPKIAAAYMRHTLEAHYAAYSSFISEEELDGYYEQSQQVVQPKQTKGRKS